MTGGSVLWELWVYLGAPLMLVVLVVVALALLVVKLIRLQLPDYQCKCLFHDYEWKGWRSVCTKCGKVL